MSPKLSIAVDLS